MKWSYALGWSNVSVVTALMSMGDLRMMWWCTFLLTLGLIQLLFFAEEKEKHE